ncbi:NACHT domain-containing protein [Vibrio alginolyticus]|uniref:NACHT domain-containing protein n=1 Tax=Vibrio alginolyticus TaxID=663 RepID=UPI0029FFD373|nr:NACHT domain-containing protein [Vibrio parahaemolyticus]
MVEEILIAGAAEGFKLSLSNLFESIKKKSNEFTKINLNTESAYRNAIQVEKVKTIWQIDKSVNLNNFYYPSKIVINDKDQNIRSLSDFPQEIKCVIQGTAGQGKSIFLRYLTGTELKSGKRIPLFIELRKISSNKNIEQLILDALSDLGIKSEIQQLDIVLSSGKISLLLDAFDEIPEENIKDTITYLESISLKHHHLQIIVSSRPNSDIQKSNSFDTYKLSPISKADFRPMLEKFFDEDKDINEIVSSINKSNSNIDQLITTPLLLTLLTITYKGYNKIPESPHEFYEGLFPLLVHRHDATKPGFSRSYSSKLNENQLEKLFHAFSFYCMLSQKVSLTRNEAILKVGKASSATGIFPAFESSFIRDCVKNTCLMVEEGLDYHFIHKSIREYHAARYIKDSDIELKEKFYSTCLINYHKYTEEIKYLKEIDSNSFQKLFLAPALAKVLEYFEWDGMEASAEGNFSDDFVLHFDECSDGEYEISGFSISSPSLISSYFNIFDEIIEYTNRSALADARQFDFDITKAEPMTSIYQPGSYEVYARDSSVFIENVSELLTKLCMDYSEQLNRLNKQISDREASINSIVF